MFADACCLMTPPEALEMALDDFDAEQILHEYDWLYGEAVDPMEVLVHVTDGRPAPDEEAESNEWAGRVQAALDDLEAVERRVIELHALEGMKLLDVARVMGLGRVQARELYGRATNKLRLSLFFAVYLDDEERAWRLMGRPWPGSQGVLSAAPRRCGGGAGNGLAKDAQMPQEASTGTQN